MIRYRFAIGAAGILGLGAIIASTKVLGEAGKGKKEQDIRSTGLMQPIHQDRQFEMKFSECRFTGHPLVTYKTQKDETYFALQLQPKLQANARMPRDILLPVRLQHLWKCREKLQGFLLKAFRLKIAFRS
jgi:hypothetical protein